MTDGIRLGLVPPFDARALLDRFRTGNNRSGLILLEPESLRFQQAVRVNEAVVPVSVQFSGTVEDPSAFASFPADTPEPLRQAAARAVSHMMNAKSDLSAFYRHFAGHDKLEKLFQALRGSKLPLDPDPFECLAKTIISQQINLSFAGTLTERLANRWGSEVYFEDKRLLVFPDAGTIARLSPDDLRPLSFSARKAEYLIGAARAVVDGVIDWPRIGRMSDEEAIAELTKLRGIGRWTVECLLIFAYGRTDLLPAADIGLRNGMFTWFGLDRRPTAAEAAAFGASWSPWRTYVTFYLWESLRLTQNRKESREPN